jgi:hypothetical protein
MALDSLLDHGIRAYGRGSLLEPVLSPEWDREMMRASQGYRYLPAVVVLPVLTAMAAAVVVACFF